MASPAQCLSMPSPSGGIAGLKARRSLIQDFSARSDYFDVMKKSLSTFLKMLLITWGMLELGSLALFSRLGGGELDYAKLGEQREQRLRQIQTVLEPSGQTSNILYSFHPYLGYTGHPGAFPWKDTGTPFNAYGMLSTAKHPYPNPQNADEFVIAVTGGSVAEIFANAGEAPLREAMSGLGMTRRIVLVNLATGGYKQPQQLFHLQYALLAGFHFDAVLNLDGFNDLALAAHNAQHGIHPLFPSGHHLGMLAKLFGSPQLDPASVAQLHHYYTLHRIEAQTLRLLRYVPLSYSPFLNLMGQLGSRLNQEYASRLKSQMAQNAIDELPAEFRGPPFDQSGSLYPSAVRTWQQASQMQFAISRAHNLPYMHVLQPNQYLKGSKPLSLDETKIAINSHNPWGITAKTGYPLLIKGGEALKQQGVPFYDLTQVFHSTYETLYVDDCCHFNGEGNRLLAMALAPLLLQEIKRQTHP